MKLDYHFKKHVNIVYIIYIFYKLIEDSNLPDSVNNSIIYIYITYNM